MSFSLAQPLRIAPLVLLLLSVNSSSPQAPGRQPNSVCRKAILEAQVEAGQGFQKVFTPGLVFMLEPLRSGWIVRVLAADEPRGPHDFAELATPPYQSVSPLLVSTDWSFRAQDAVAWNPRRFQYAKDKAVFRALAALQPGALAGNTDSMVKVAEIVAGQPEATLQILHTRLAPGLANQAAMASAVALHLEQTPYDVDRSAPPSALGKLESLRFRAELTLSPNARAVSGILEESCTKAAAKPTAKVPVASQRTSSRLQAR